MPVEVFAHFLLLFVRLVFVHDSGFLRAALRLACLVLSELTEQSEISCLRSLF
jgi:hypothetical protein